MQVQWLSCRTPSTRQACDEIRGKDGKSGLRVYLPISSLKQEYELHNDPTWIDYIHTLDVVVMKVTTWRRRRLFEGCNLSMNRERVALVNSLGLPSAYTSIRQWRHRPVSPKSYTHNQRMHHFENPPGSLRVWCIQSQVQYLTVSQVLIFNNGMRV